MSQGILLPDGLMIKTTSGTLERMLRAYFDTTVPSWIVKGQVPPEDVGAVRAAVRAGRIRVPVSLGNLDELTGELETDRGAMIAKFALLRDLVGFHGMLKQPRDLLKEAIESYAAGIDPPPVVLPERERRQVVGFLADVIAGSRRHDEDLKQIVAGVDELKETWLRGMREAQRRALADPDWAGHTLEERQRMTFQQFFEVAAPSLAEDLAVRLGCAEACRRRGLDGLVALRPVRLGVGVITSQIYPQLVGTPGQPDLRLAARTDGYDVWHAILGSTADVFVTFDDRLAAHVERIPGPGGVRVVRSIAELLTVV